MLEMWDLIHPSFPNETISTYVRNLNTVKLAKNKVNSGYSKSPISTSAQIGSVHKGCTKLRQKILKRYSDVFRDRLDKHDRINIKPVHL